VATDAVHYVNESLVSHSSNPLEKYFMQSFLTNLNKRHII